MKSLSDKPFEFRSVNGLIADSILNHWEREALTNFHGETLRYGDLAREIARMHLAFDAIGIKKGDKMALCSRNQANWGVCFLAALTYGAVPVPILHEFRPDTIHHLVRHSEAVVFFVGAHLWSELDAREIPDVSLIVEIDSLKPLHTATSAMGEALAGLDAAFAARYPSGVRAEHVSYYKDSPDELAMINYTSGTSGFSKGVMIPYRALSSNIQFAHLAVPRFNETSTIVSMLPSAHMYGMMFEFFYEVVAGAHIFFLQNAPSPKILLGAIAEVKPTLVVAVPLIIEKIYKSKLKPVRDKFGLLFKIPGIRRILCNKVRNELLAAFGGQIDEVILGGAAFNPEVEEFLHMIRFPYTVGYGMTEGAPIFSYVYWDKVRMGSCGIVAPWNEMRIDSPDPENVPGEVCFHGPNVFLGYYKNEEATADAFTSDGWFRTGDMGVVDKDGFLYLRGRCKCMILGPSGQNIYPEELEAVINNFPFVSDSLVIEDEDHLTALVYPDWLAARAAGLDKETLDEKFRALLPEINKAVPAYAHIKKIELREEDFERTPKRSIKRHLYQKITDLK